MQVDFFGEVLSGIGYGPVNRDLIRTLEAGGIDIRLVARDDHVNDSLRISDPYWTSRIAMSSGKDPSDIRIVAGIPEMHVLEEGKKHLGMTLWPTDIFPHQWVPLMRRLHKVIVPDGALKGALYKAGLQDRVVIIKPCPDLSLWNPDGPKISMPGVQEDDVLFCISGEWATRTNFFDVITAFCRSFHQVKDVHLVVNSYSIEHGPDGRRKMADSLRGHVGALHGLDRPRIHFLPEVLGDHQLAMLFRRASAYISCNHGEAFHSSLVRAMACGTPGVGVKFLQSASLIHKFPVDHSLMPVYGEPSPLMEATQSWARPDVQCLSTQLRTIYEMEKSSDPILDRAGRDARALIEQLYNPAEQAQTFLEIVKELS